MRKITGSEFWQHVMEAKIDVHPSIVGKYPYTSIFKTRDGVEVGRIVSTVINDEKVTEYFWTE